MLASIAISSSTDHLAEFIGSIGHCSPPIGTLFGPGNIVWDFKPPREIQGTHWVPGAGLRSQILFSDPNKVPIGGNNDLWTQ